MEKMKQAVSEEDLKMAFVGGSSEDDKPKINKKEKVAKTKNRMPKEEKSPSDKKMLIFLIIGVIGLVAGITMIIVALLLTINMIFAPFCAILFGAEAIMPYYKASVIKLQMTKRIYLDMELMIQILMVELQVLVLMPKELIWLQEC